jgi:transcriptional regulator with XRE-family HTH domain
MNIERLKKAKKQNKMTFEELSLKSGVPLSTIYDIFRGVTTAPRVDTLEQLEKALGLKDGSEEMNIDIEKWKRAKQDKNLSYDDLVKITGLSRSTITNIFCGYVDLPRFETVRIIEKALGLSGEEKPIAKNHEPSDSEKQLLAAYGKLPPNLQGYLVDTSEKLVQAYSGNAIPTQNKSVNAETMSTIDYLVQAKKAKKITLQEISDKSGIPKRTVDDIFSGHTETPRLDTVEALVNALGLKLVLEDTNNEQ